MGHLKFFCKGTPEDQAMEDTLGGGSVPTPIKQFRESVESITESTVRGQDQVAWGKYILIHSRL